MMSDSIMSAGDGNIGATNVLTRLYAEFGEGWMARLLSCAKATNTKSSNFWIIYKDECRYDIEKTKVVLDRWLADGNLGLGEWIRERGLKSSPDAEI